MEVWLILLILAVPLIVLWVWAIVDAIRRSDLSQVRRVAWVGILVLVPVIGLAVYVVVRPPRGRRLGVSDEAGAATAAALVDAAEAHRRGDLSDVDYRRTVAELGGPV